MDNEAFEMGVMDGDHLGKNGKETGVKPNGDLTHSPIPHEVRVAEEIARYDEVRGVAETGNGLKLDKLLAELEQQGLLRDWRSERNVTLYADAISDSFLGKFGCRKVKSGPRSKETCASIMKLATYNLSRSKRNVNRYLLLL